MKNLLFSRSHKKHYTDAVVRMGKNNLGFSLVELIIIIAIMAVLVAIAIPVLTVFIEKSHIANDKQAVSDVMYAINLGGQSMQNEVECAQLSESGLQLPVGFIILTDGTDKDGNTVASLRVIGSDANNVNKLAIEAMLDEALGAGYANFALSYDGWGNTTDIPNLYADADDLYEQVKSLSNLLATGGGLLNTLKGQGSVGSYDSGVDVVSSVAFAIVTQMDEDEFANAWKTSTGNSAFGFDGTIITDINQKIEQYNATVTEDDRLSTLGKMEVYTAIRRAYNEALAKFVAAKSNNHNANHLDKIVKYGDGIDALNMVASDKMGSYVIESDAIKPDSHRCGLGCILGCSAEGDFSDEVQKCEECVKWIKAYEDYNTYSESDVDARAFYKVMATMNDSSADANGSWDMYTNIVNNFSDIYENLEEVTSSLDNCIVITVYQNADGVMYAECNTPGVLDE